MKKSYGEFYKFTVKDNKKTNKLFGVFEVSFGILLIVSRSQCPHCSLLPHSNLLKTNFKNPQNEFIELTL
ncbi:MAG: hypothetical protein MJ001_04595 [Paludibacteraceae bacterium]|nr:hypothetical protein [Paludibacteraceae bacterium]